MKKLVTTFCVIAMVTWLVRAEETTAARMSNVYQERQYDMTVTHTDLEKAPIWRTDQEDPPLGARVAARIAREHVSRFVPNSGDWRLNRITLEPVGRREGQWIYIIEFTPYEGTKILLSGVRQFKVPVLLNGMVEDPKITNLSEGRKK